VKNAWCVVTTGGVVPRKISRALVLANEDAYNGDDVRD